ncbi:methyltransferase domain-containing protein [Pseudorhodoplanes sinuspersici]|uniref:methyltransferase domain-containing protein n=1 Tax=Pseudorhodoplanes sinuspersici TaxID=1235591 RepID=UPI000FF0293E|nr:methyltransferase domain-containing protein [Pseudorhodoplanes sinuspersici]RKE74163.1 glycosyl transferase family 2 [Pseudorhodoplanes sinuspersici]
MDDRYFIKNSYTSRTSVPHFGDRPVADGDVIYQPDAYALAAFLGARYGAKTIIDIGCGSALNLMAMTGFKTIGVDGGANLAFCRQTFPTATWIEADLETALNLRLEESEIKQSVVICADVIEHLVDPRNLLAGLLKISRLTKAIIITTPERDRVRGPNDMGPPADPAHAREWSRQEFEALLSAAGLAPSFCGLTVNNNRDLEKKTILAIADQTSKRQNLRVPERFRPLSIIATYNERDIAPGVVIGLLNDGFDVHVIDNWSEDGTFETLARFDHPGLVLERFPADGPALYFEWKQILRRKTDIAQQHPGRWIIHQDADEIRTSPWSDCSFRKGLYVAECMDFNAVDFTVINFRPIDDRFRDGFNVETVLDHFQFGRRPPRGSQIKAWRQGKVPVELATSGGHEAVFPERRIFPYKFILKHYPLRNQAQALRKVFKERLARFSPAERAIGMHIHYDKWPADHQFFWNKNDLIQFDDIDTRREHVTELIAGIGSVPS